MSAREVARPDVQATLGVLKGFQRAAVEVAFERLYTAPDSSRRFLVADEVGLGKTLIARGIVAKAIDHLWGEVERIDVVYVCSNAAIARQNVRKLGFGTTFPVDRLTLLPVTAHALARNDLNFVACTPGTSFEMASHLGIGRERRLLYHLLERIWPVGGAGPKNVLQGTIGSKSKWRASLRSFLEQETIDEGLREAFRETLEEADLRERESGGPGLRSRWEKACKLFGYYREHWPAESVRLRGRLVGELRGLLAKSCIGALEPDLVILDEFQRFKHLLDPKVGGDAAELARRLFEWQDEHAQARVLLLSATPYKMYTLAHEAEEDDHYRDFLKTVEFLQDDAGETAALRSELDRYRRAMYRLRWGGEEELRALKTSIEERLRRVMSRTERTGATERLDGMLRSVPVEGVALEPRDVEDFVRLERLARAVDQGGLVELWKSAPYVLSFADGYKFKTEVERRLDGERPDGAIVKLLEEARDTLLDPVAIERYGRVDPANARLRALLDDVVESGLWRCLWLPPSMPSYGLEGAFARAVGATKRLVFSAWHVVPKAIAALVSYEVERRAFHAAEEDALNTPEARKRRRAPLQLTRSEGRLTGMPVLALMAPWAELGRLGDPRSVPLEGDDPPALGSMLRLVEERVAAALEGILGEAPRSGAEDDAWYWAAPLRLDLADPQGGPAAREWWTRRDLAAEWARAPEGRRTDEQESGEDEGWAAHVERVRELVLGRLELGRPPADLAAVLARLAIGGPGVCASRSLARVLPDSGSWDLAVRTAGARIGWGFRSLLNGPEATAVVRGRDRRSAYWRRVLEYACAGGLSDVLDEYVHVVRELEGLFDADAEQGAATIADVAMEALTLRAARQEYHAFEFHGDGRVRVERERMRGHYSMRFGTDRSEDGNAGQRGDQVRTAFNSPFWPFVLASTSIGQEGLDFHAYCHAVVHWNLPSNPVDLEQREGRVHRYKGHAIRKNVVRAHGALERREPRSADPWTGVFERADIAAAGGRGGLVPFWVHEGEARIERRVPALPLSKDGIRLESLRRSLAVYRMVFGQPRQDDLLAFLQEHVEKAELETLLPHLRIDLSPVATGRS